VTAKRSKPSGPAWPASSLPANGARGGRRRANDGGAAAAVAAARRGSGGGQRRSDRRGIRANTPGKNNPPGRGEPGPTPGEKA